MTIKPAIATVFRSTAPVLPLRAGGLLPSAANCNLDFAEAQVVISHCGQQGKLIYHSERPKGAKNLAFSHGINEILRRRRSY